MGNFNRWVLPALITVAVGVPGTAQAAIIAFTHVVDGTNTYYTLNVQEGCDTNCDVQLQIEFDDPNAFEGKYLDSIQFKIDGSAPTSTPTLFATTAGSTTDWTVQLASLNANECSGGDSNSTCAEWNLASVGFLIVVPGTYTWDFKVNWEEPLVLGENLVSGNIRAAYNNEDGSNFDIFSPGGTTFTNGGGGGGGGGGVVVPEPASLLLFGLAVAAGGRRFRRRFDQ